MTDLSRDIFFCLPGPESRLVEEGLDAEGGEDNLESVIDRSEYRAFRVCRMKPEEVRYRGKPEPIHACEQKAFRMIVCRKADLRYARSLGTVPVVPQAVCRTVVL